MSQASAAIALRSTFGVINETANAVSNLANTAGSAISMLNRYVQDARVKQDMSSKVAMSDYQEHLIEDKSLENARRSFAIKQELDQEPQLEAMFNEHRDRISKLFQTETA